MPFRRRGIGRKSVFFKKEERSYRYGMEEEKIWGGGGGGRPSFEELKDALRQQFLQKQSSPDLDALQTIIKNWVKDKIFSEEDVKKAQREIDAERMKRATGR